MSGTIPVRATRRILWASGFKIRNQGKHEQWVDDAGRMVSLPHKPVGGALYGFLAQQIRHIERGARPTKDNAKRRGLC